MSDPVRSIAINAVGAQCCDQMAKYKAHKESTSAYCLELFRRALQGHAEREIAWQHLLEGCVGDQVRSAFYRHPSRYRALVHQNEQFYVVEAFARFWRSNEGRPLRLDSLAGLFALLHRCLHSALLEEIRIWTPPGSRGRKPQSTDSQPIEDTRHWPSPTPMYLEPATESDVDEGVRSRECAREIWACAKSDREHRLLGLRWLGYTPLQIVDRWPDQYPTTREVGQILQNILARYHRRKRKQEQEDDEK
jgi:hypothetical protein